MGDACETRLDELEALVVGVISQTVALRREGEAAWERSLTRLESGVAALTRYVHQMRRQAHESRPSARRVYRFPSDPFLQGPVGAPRARHDKRGTREL